MRVLLDENLHRKLKRSFDHGIEVMTVADRGWQGDDTEPLMRDVGAAIETLRPGQLVMVGHET